MNYIKKNNFGIGSLSFVISIIATSILFIDISPINFLRHSKVYGIIVVTLFIFSIFLSRKHPADLLSKIGKNIAIICLTLLIVFLIFSFIGAFFT